MAISCSNDSDSGTTNNPPSDNGNGGGNTGGATGNAMFWVSSDLGCGNISVTINGETKTISSYYSSLTPNCGAVGCANYTLPAGTYNYSASCSSKTWSGTINVTNDNCSKMQLTNSNTGGSGGGGSGGGNNCTNMNSYVTAQGTMINNCGSGGNNDLSVRVTNNSTQTLYIRIIIKKNNGTFDCGGVTVLPGSYGTYWSCNASDYRFSAILNSEFGNGCFGACMF